MTGPRIRKLGRMHFWLLLIMMGIGLFLFMTGTISAKTSSNTFYATADVTLDEYYRSRNYGYSTKCYVSGNKGRERSTLIKWNVSSLPGNSRINKATIYLQIDNASKNRFSVYAVKKDWEESEATWLKANDSLPWRRYGAKSTTYRREDRDAKPSGALLASNTGTAKFDLNADLVQEWLDDSSSNYGVIIAEGSSSATDDIAFFCSEVSQKTYRPKLAVEYQY